jgi:hypothetical protein
LRAIAADKFADVVDLPIPPLPYTARIKDMVVILPLATIDERQIGRIRPTDWA